MDLRLAKWEKNGFKRIYVNSPVLGGTKIWFQANSEGKLTEKKGEIFTTNERYFADTAIEEAYALLEEKAGGWGYELPLFDTIFASL
jgi:hypothetical protein